LKVIGYATVALVVTLSAITYQIGHSIMMSADERALKVFEGDAKSESMAAFVNFISESGRNYKDHTETARKYRNFKENYVIVQKGKEHERHMPYKISINSKFADLSAAEFLSLVSGGASVPESVMSPQAKDGKSLFSARPEYVPLFDKVEGELPESKNWF
jgi:hypothetical protein